MQTKSKSTDYRELVENEMRLYDHFNHQYQEKIEKGKVEESLADLTKALNTSFQAVAYLNQIWHKTWENRPDDSGLMRDIITVILEQFVDKKTDGAHTAPLVGLLSSAYMAYSVFASITEMDAYILSIPSLEESENLVETKCTAKSDSQVIDHYKAVINQILARLESHWERYIETSKNTDKNVEDLANSLQGLTIATKDAILSIRSALRILV